MRGFDLVRELGERAAPAVGTGLRALVEALDPSLAASAKRGTPGDASDVSAVDDHGTEIHIGDGLWMMVVDRDPDGSETIDCMSGMPVGREMRGLVTRINNNAGPNGTVTIESLHGRRATEDQGCSQDVEGRWLKWEPANDSDFEDSDDFTDDY